ncbi:MAG: adenylate kinase [Candidatus Aenigmarchaeota archaeon]|nr:adenylate kinase [Candidatus Aenigmarchaeota archaeon]
MKIVFLGPPGSGKGTYSSRLVPKLGIPHISTGDLFRENIKNETALGKKVKEIIDAGKLVPDEVTAEMLKERIEKPDAKKGFILDGFPRTMSQVEALDKLTKIDIVINLILPDHILIKKIAARRQCRKCGDIYNLADINEDGIHMPPLLPKVEGKCDKCGGEIYQRDDDKEEIVMSRLDVYKKQTAPLIEYYRGKNLLKDVPVVGGPDIMVPNIIKVLETISS